MERQYRFGAVIPAAGLSSRMGMFKPLLPYGGRTVIEASVGSVIPYISTASVVVGHRGKELADLLRRSFSDRLNVVTNPDYASSDMLRSVQLGLRALGACDAFFLLPADMPLISGAVYAALTSAYDGAADVIYPVIEGRRGHPPLISARLIPVILSYRGDGGLRAILSERVAKDVALTDKGILTDLDTPQDYQKICRSCPKAANHQLPTKPE